MFLNRFFAFQRVAIPVSNANFEDVHAFFAY